MKKCTKCNETKPRNDFYKDRGYFRPRCKRCHSIYQKEYQKKNYPMLAKRRQAKLKRIKNTYGLGSGTVGRFGLKLALRVYEKANHKCRHCETNCDLVIHHKDHNGRNKEMLGLKANNNLNNLLLLCRACHGSIHGKQGKGITKKGSAINA